MSEYTPDSWVVVELNDGNGNTHRRVFAGWFGGYTTGESWKMSSGIKHYTLTDDAIAFHGESGSVYKCRKANYGMTAYMQTIFDSFVKDTEGTNMSIKIIEGFEFL